MIKLIATDMDGTFLDSHKIFDFSFISSFYKMLDKNIKFTIASGNQFLRLYHQFIPMSDHMFFIADNGALIAKGAKVIKTHLLDDNVLKEVLENLSSLNIMIIFSGLNGVHVLTKDKKYEHVVSMYYRNIHYHDNFNILDDKIMKIAIYDPLSDIHLYEDKIRALIPSTLAATTAGNEWLDIQNKDVNKGNAIKFLQEIYQIKEDECVCFGDAMNDETMFKHVKYAYAMKNADPRIKDIAYDTLPFTNDEQGVLKKINEIIL